MNNIEVMPSHEASELYEGVLSRFKEDFDSFFVDALPDDFVEMSRGKYSNGEDLAYQMYKEKNDHESEYFIFSPNEFQIFEIFMYGAEFTWEGATGDKMHSWSEVEETIINEGWKGVGSANSKEYPYILARPWKFTEVFEKDSEVDIGIYNNLSEKESEYSMVVESGTLQAHVIQKFGYGPEAAFIDILRVPSNEKNRRAGLGLKNSLLDVKGRNPKITKDQSSFKAQMRSILLQLQKMGITTLFAEPSDFRRARIYSMFGFKLIDELRGIYSADINEVLSGGE